MHAEFLKEKKNTPVLIPEAPVVNPNAALGTPPRLNSDGEADPEVEEILDTSEGTDEGTFSMFCIFLFFLFRDGRLCILFDVKRQWSMTRKTEGQNTNTRWTWKRILAISWR